MKAERYLYAHIHLVLSARVAMATAGGLEANWGSQLPLVKVVMTMRKPEVLPRSKDRHRQTGGRGREMDRGREKQRQKEGVERKATN